LGSTAICSAERFRASEGAFIVHVEGAVGAFNVAVWAFEASREGWDPQLGLRVWNLGNGIYGDLLR
jgi:hypothetical protein